MTTPDPTTLVYWPLVITIEDCFVPEVAPRLLEAVAEVDVQTVGAMVACRSYLAQLELEGRRN